VGEKTLVARSKGLIARGELVEELTIDDPKSS
jgi:hypothetical protein